MSLFIKSKLSGGLGETQCQWAQPSLPTSRETYKRAVPANVPVGSTASAMVEFTSSPDTAIGFEPESVWPVIAMLWDIHGVHGVYDLGVIGVWMSGVGAVMYVARIEHMTGVEVTI